MSLCISLAIYYLIWPTFTFCRPKYFTSKRRPLESLDFIKEPPAALDVHRICGSDDDGTTCFNNNDGNVHRLLQPAFINVAFVQNVFSIFQQDFYKIRALMFWLHEHSNDMPFVRVFLILFMRKKVIPTNLKDG